MPVQVTVGTYLMAMKHHWLKVKIAYLSEDGCSVLTENVW